MGTYYGHPRLDEGQMDQSEKLSRTGIYQTADAPTIAELKAIGVNKPYPGKCYPRFIGAVWTGEKRPPRKGEWYLSGSKIEAYRAPNDLSTEYHIARLVPKVLSSIPAWVDIS